MAMAGLFWITDDAAYVGAEPVGAAPGVRLLKDGVEVLGGDHARFWAWDQVLRIEVLDVPVRSAARRRLRMAVDAAMVLVTGDGQLPPAFTVRVETADETVEVSVLAAITGGIYGPVEYELSRTLLRRLADGSFRVDALLAWSRDRGDAGTPHREEREALLLRWAGE
jgi:hypothetical protein